MVPRSSISRPAPVALHALCTLMLALAQVLVVLPPLLAARPAPALAAIAGVPGEIRYARTVVNVREERSTGSAVVEQMQPGREVVAAYPRDGWVAVFEPLQEAREIPQPLGYVFAKLLSPEPPPGVTPHRTDPSEILYARTAANIRAARSTGAKRIGQLQPGDAIKAAFPREGWYAVYVPDQDVTEEPLGYVFGDLLTAAAPEGGAQQADVAQPEGEDAVPENGVVEPQQRPDTAKAAQSADAADGVMYAATGVNVRQAPAPDAERVFQLRPGQPVAVGAEQDGWLAVYPEGRTPSGPPTGFVLGTLLLPQRDARLLRAPRRLNVRKSRTTDSGVARKLAPGDIVLGNDFENGWFAIHPAGSAGSGRPMGYVLGRLLEEVAYDPVPEPSALTAAEPAPPAENDDAEQADAASPAIGEQPAPAAPPTAAQQAVATQEGEILFALSTSNVREDRTARSPISTVLRPGDPVVASGLSDGWYAVAAPPTASRPAPLPLGYVFAKLIGPPPGEPVAVPMRTTTRANVRSAPSTSGRLLATIEPQALIWAGFEQDGWYRIFAVDNRRVNRSLGFIHGNLVQPAPRDAIVAPGWQTDEPPLLAAPSAAAPQQPQPQTQAQPQSQAGSTPAATDVEKPSAPQTPAPDTAAAAPKAEPATVDEEAATPAKQAESASQPEPESVAEQAAPAAQAEPDAPAVPVETMYARTNVNVRTGRGANTPRAMVLKPGQAVQAGYPRHGWLAIFPADAVPRTEAAAQGYVLATLLTDGTDADETPVAAHMRTIRRANVRSKPALSGRRGATLDANVRVWAGFETNGWYEVYALESDDTPGRLLGYVFGKLLAPEAPQNPEPEQAATPEDKAEAPRPAARTEAPGPKAAEQADQPRPEAETAQARQTEQTKDEPAGQDVRSGPATEPAAAPSPVAPAPAAPDTMYAAAAVELHEARDAESAFAGQLLPGQQVRARFLRNGWYAVFAPASDAASEAEAMGYAPASLLTPQPPADEPGPVVELSTTPAVDPGVVRVAARTVDIRAARTSDAPVAGRLRPGDKVRAAYLKDDWYAIFSPEADTSGKPLGYVYAPYLKAPQKDAEQWRLTQPDDRTDNATPAQPEATSEQPQAAPEQAAEPVAPLGTRPQALRRDEPAHPAVAEEPAPQPSAASHPVETVPMRARTTANIRRRPTTASPVLGKLKSGDSVRAGAEQDGWRPVYSGDGNAGQPRGWIYATLLEPDPDAALPVDHDAARQAEKKQAVQTGNTDSIPDYKVAGVEVEGGRKTITIILQVDVLPSDKALQRMAWNMWFEERRKREEMHLYIYLPDMDTRDLAYAIARFYKGGMSEFRTRKSVLFGTKWMQ